MKLRLILLLTILSVVNSFGQNNLTQTIKGKIIDKYSQVPILSVVVRVITNNKEFVGMTNLDGYYKIENVPVGRVNLFAEVLGYSPYVANGIEVTSGKEVVFNFSLEEEITKIKEVVIKTKDNNNPENKSVVASDIHLDPQQTGKFAGTLQDVSRMAANYAGVVPAGDQRNDIIVRGNSPTGLLWRLEGVNIPNPNHFGSQGATGGPVSILNNNNLASSDFLTAAFPAEYGNATAGAFDLKLRSGNRDKFEFTGQLGFNGLEVGLEGPLSKKGKGSFLINYRYSTLGVFKAMGISFGVSGVPQYQDIAFKLDLPVAAKYGKFEIFGIGGLSYIELLDSDKDPEEWSYSNSGTNLYWGSDMGVAGFKHTIFLSKKTFLKTTLAATGSKNTGRVDTLGLLNQIPSTTYSNKSTDWKYSISSVLNTKFNAKSSMRLGVIADKIYANYFEEVLGNGGNTWYPLIDYKGNTDLLQTYAQFRHKFNNKFVFNGGLHYQLLTLNNSQIVEPRLGLKYRLNKKHSLALASGLHSQMHPLRVYFLETTSNGSNFRTNENLNFTKSIHNVISYNYSITKNFRIKGEAYHQYLYDIPVEANGHFSLTNAGADFIWPDVDSLQNNGTGENYGLEITLEKMLSNNYYFLLNGSFYESTYKGGDGIKRNTAFNGSFTTNLLGGYEYKINDRYSVDANIKVSYAGGKRYQAIDIEASKEAGTLVHDNNSVFTSKYPDFFRTDLKIGYKINSKKISQTVAFDVQNIFNTKNVFRRFYDEGSQSIKDEYQLGIFPSALYRIQF